MSIKASKISFWKSPTWLYWTTMVFGVYLTAGFVIDLSEPFSKWTGHSVSAFNWLVVPTMMFMISGVTIVVTQRRHLLLILTSVVEVYAQIAVNFAMVYAENYAHYHASFHGTIQSPLDFLYFSITTLSTTGYGDIAAVTTYLRMVVSLEIVVGMVWTAIGFGFIVNSIVSSRL